MEKQNKPTLTLTLPYIELPAGKEVNDVKFYDESGIYFVKSSYGDFHIVEVIKEENNAFGNPLSLNTGSLLFEQIIENKLNERLRYLEEELVSFHNEMNAHMNALRQDKLPDLVERFDSIDESLVDMHGKVNGLQEWEVLLDKRILEVLKKAGSESTPIKGSISEDALVQLIKEIKK